ncbi:MAG: DUF4230 domain-containing protein [Prevotella sp.]|nr:DUF4230 domain-containing protein [Prevotella sp.]
MENKHTADNTTQAQSGQHLTGHAAAGQPQHELQRPRRFSPSSLSLRLLGCALAPLLLIGMGIGMFFWLNSSNKVSLEADERIDITPARIQQIQDIGQWEFLAISDEELVDTVSRGFFADGELVRIYYGTVRLGIDLHKAGPHWLRTEGDSIVVASLPPIELLDRNFIDEARSRSFFEKGKWTAADRMELYNRAYSKMLARCMTPENIKTAGENARQQFAQFLKSMGYKRVRVSIAPSAASEPEADKAL